MLITVKPMNSSKVPLTNFLWQMILARVDEKICQISIGHVPVFICQRK